MRQANNSMINLDKIFKNYNQSELEIVVTQNYKDDRPCLWECGTNLGNRIAIIGILDEKGHRKRPVMYMYGRGREMGYRSALHHITPGHKVITAVMARENDKSKSPLYFGVWEIQELRGKEVNGTVREVALLKKVAEQKFDSYQEYSIQVNSSNVDAQMIHMVAEPEMLGQIPLIFKDKIKGHRSAAPWLSRRWKVIRNGELSGELTVSSNTNDSLYKIYTTIEEEAFRYVNTEKFYRSKKEERFGLIPKMFIRYMLDGNTILKMQIVPIIGGEAMNGHEIVFQDINKVKNFCTPIHDSWSERDLEFLLDEVKEAGGVLDRFYQFLG